MIRTKKISKIDHQFFFICKLLTKFIYNFYKKECFYNNLKLKIFIKIISQSNHCETLYKNRITHFESFKLIKMVK